MAGRAMWRVVAGFLVWGMVAAAWGDGLRTVKSEHYLIHTDLPKKFVDELIQRMNIMYGEYEKALPGFHQPADAGLLPAYLFTNQSEYVAMTKNKVTGGMFVPSDHPYLAAHMGSGRDELRKVLQHEAFHQFAHFAIADQLAPWINEGIAQVFQEGVWNGTEFWMGQVPPWRIRLLQTDVTAHRLVEFKKFLAIPRDEWNKEMGGKEDLGSTNYNEAWALAHFLLESGRLNYREHLMAYLNDRHAGMGEAEAVGKNFPNLTALQGDFSAWAVGLRPTAGATAMERQKMLGTFLQAAHEQNFHFKDMAAFRAFVLANNMHFDMTEGRVKYKTAKDPAEYFCDAAGRMFGPEALVLTGGNEAGLARDIVCHVSGAEQFRTHFYKFGEETGIGCWCRSRGSEGGDWNHGEHGGGVGSRR